MEKIGLREAKWVKSITTAASSFLDIFENLCYMYKEVIPQRTPKFYILSTCPALESIMAFSASSPFHFHSCPKEEKWELNLILALWHFESPFKSWNIPAYAHSGIDQRTAGSGDMPYGQEPACYALPYQGLRYPQPGWDLVWVSRAKLDRKKPFGGESPVHGVLWIVTSTWKCFKNLH